MTVHVTRNREISAGELGTTSKIILRGTTLKVKSDLRDTGAMLYQLSYEATRWERDQFIEFISSRAVLSNCLNWKIYCDDHSSLSSTTAVQI